MYKKLCIIAAAVLLVAAVTLFAQPGSPQQSGAPQQPGRGGPGGPGGRGGGSPLNVAPSADHPLMTIGTAFPDFNLPGVDGKNHTLAEFKGGKALIVLFECVHCPVSQNYEGRSIALYQKFSPQGVKFVGINPNNPKAVQLRELNYTDLSDSLDDMKIRAAQRHIPWQYLYDGETQRITQIFGAMATPHVFIFDADLKLRYQGRIDDNQNEDLVKVRDAADALDQLLAGKPVENPTRPAFGCSTKWLEKSQGVEQELARVQARPVNVSTLAKDGLGALKANEGQKVAVIHFWSTSNKGAVANFKDLMTTWYWYESRPYQFITVNVDGVGDTKATDFLKAQFASATNYSLAPADLDAAMTALGTRWDKSREFTIVLAPGGKVVYSRVGPVNIQDIRHASLITFPDNRTFPGQAKYWNELKWF
ncbi:MAG: thioredoxin family protein [Candidatus Solibacter sp.]|nr:thioredoxin family protein [Candidatus Solibacter sp.]